MSFGEHIFSQPYYQRHWLNDSKNVCPQNYIRKTWCLRKRPRAEALFGGPVLAKPYLKRLFWNKTPRWAYKHNQLEHMCSPNHIKNHLLFCYKTPRWVYENYHLENMCSLLLWTKIPRGLMKTIVWRTCVRKTILETVALE